MFGGCRECFFGEIGGFFDDGTDRDLSCFWDCCILWLDGFLFFFPWVADTVFALDSSCGTADLCSDMGGLFAVGLPGADEGFSLGSACCTADLCPDTGSLFFGGGFGADSGAVSLLGSACCTADLCPDTGSLFLGGGFGTDSGAVSLLGSACGTADLCPDTGGLFAVGLSRTDGGAVSSLGSACGTADLCSDMGGLFAVGLPVADKGNMEFGAVGRGDYFNVSEGEQRYIIEESNLPFENAEITRAEVIHPKNNVGAATEISIGEDIFSGDIGGVADKYIGLIAGQIENKIRSEFLAESSRGGLNSELVRGGRSGEIYHRSEFEEDDRLIDKVARSLGAALEFCAEGVHS